MEPSGGDKGKEKAYANADRGRGCHDLDHDEIHPPFETWNCPFNVYFTRTRPTKAINPARHKGEECKAYLNPSTSTLYSLTSACADKKGSCCIGRTCLCYRQHAECGKDCPCKCSALAAFSVCGNQHLRRAEGASVVHTSIVRDMSKRHNRFLINEPVKSGQLIVEMTGIVMDTEQLKPSVPELGEYHVAHCYQHRDLCFDMRTFGNLAKYIRCVCQACRPSARVVEVYVDGDLRLGVFARQDLKAGDEVTIPFDRDPSPAHIIRCPELISNACLFRSQERTQRFTNHAYVEPRQLDIYRFIIKMMVMDPKAYLKLEKLWRLPRGAHFKLLQAAAVPSAKASTNKKKRPDKGKERLTLVEGANDSNARIDLDLEDTAMELAGGAYGATQAGYGWEMLTDAQRDMLPMAFPDVDAMPPVEEQPIVVIPDPPTFEQDRLLLEEIGRWQRTNCERVQYAGEWNKMIKRHTRSKSTNLNINLQWARYNDPTDKRSILPRNFGPKSKLMTLASQLSHLALTPCECQFTAAAFQDLARFTNLRSLGVDSLKCVRDEVLAPFSALTQLVHLGLRSFNSGLKSIDLGQGQIVQQDNVAELFTIFPGLVALTLDESPSVTDELVMSLPYVSSSSSSSSSTHSFCPLLSLSLAECRELTPTGVNSICPTSFPFLTSLSLAGTSVPLELEGLTRLRHLNLANNVCALDIGRTLARLQGLTRLDLSNNTDLSYEEMSVVANSLPRLEQLNLSGCPQAQGLSHMLKLYLPPTCTLVVEP